MIEMYVQLILQGKRSFEEVPEHIKFEVKNRLLQNGRKDLIEE